MENQLRMGECHDILKCTHCAQQVHTVLRNKYRYKDIPQQPSLPISFLIPSLGHTPHFDHTLYFSASPPAGPQQHDTVNYYES